MKCLQRLKWQLREMPESQSLVCVWEPSQPIATFSLGAGPSESSSPCRALPSALWQAPLKGDQCRGFPVWASTLWQSTRVCFAFVDLVSIHTYFFLFFSRAVGGFWVSLTPAEYASHEGSECWQAEQLF